VLLVLVQLNFFTNYIGRSITESTGERRATEYLLQRLSVAIQQGNAASVLGTVVLESADSQKLDAVFVFNNLQLLFS